ncbi:Ankyrin-1-like [Oopsacas minuta]|uniref:Ankyrin-1-like n=1 Tax=Oopsacas minuta TaxID=111878 RepID=A0AAV7JGN5_9METZ|nr:Ankyrin-1-like [Oopsacas minuta]
MDTRKLVRQATFGDPGLKEMHKTPSQDSQISRQSIKESKLCTISIASFPFKKDQILLGKPAIDEHYMVVSSLSDVAETRQVPSSIVHELTYSYVEDELKHDENHFDFLISKLAEPDLREIIDLAIEQLPSIFDPKSSPQVRESIFLLIVKLGKTEILEYFYDKWSEEIDFLRITDSDGNTLLHTAVLNCNSVTFKTVLDKATEITSHAFTSERGNVKKSHSHSTEKLDLTDYINTANNAGYTAIHLAVDFTFSLGIEVLIQKGGDVTISNNENNTLLHSAAINNKAKSLRIVSDTLRGISKEGIFTWKQELQRKNGIGYIPVMLATEKSSIKILLEYSNLEEHVHDEHGNLLHWATANNRTHLITLLLEQEHIELEQENERGLTPLCIASRWGYMLITESLLKAGTKPNFVCSTGLTAMNYACQYGHSEVVEYLLQLGAELNSDEMENSALHSAIYGGQVEISKYLLDVHHIDPNLYKSKGTPLYEAIKGGRTPCVKLLLKHGANPQLSLDVHGFRPLHAAIKNNQRQAVKLLLQFGAGADETMFGGVTPAILAAENDQANLLSLLMDEGISITKTDDLGNTILHHIAMNEAYHCAEYLAQRAGEYKEWESSIYETKNSQNLTPIDIALSKKEEHILSLFMSLTPGEFFTEHPETIHELYDQKYYTIIKGIIGKMIKSTSPNYVLSTKFLESNALGQYPTDPGFKRFEATLLHKLRDCPDPEIKYHPMLNAVVTEKLRMYNWWYFVSFIFYVIFMVCLSYSLYHSSIHCDYLLLYPRGLTNAYEIGRLGCELYVLLYGLFFALSEIFEFFIEWQQTYKEKGLKHKLKLENYIQKWTFRERRLPSDASEISYLQYLLNAVKIFEIIDRFSLYFFSSVISFYDAFNLFDSSSVIFFILLVVFRALQMPIQWFCASLAFISFSLSLFKYTRIFPSLGSYVQSIIRIYKIDIPRYASIVVILLIAFYGGIHLASRQGQITLESFGPVSDDSLCNASEQAFYWIPSQYNGETQVYQPRLSLIAGIIFLLDGGPSEYQEGLKDTSTLFIIIYFLMAFTIIIVMSNVLIAQLTQTYSNIIKLDKFHYKIDLVVTFELKSNLSLFFGKYTRSLTSFNQMIVPVHIWNAMREESPEKESDIKISEILNRVNKGADRLRDDSLKMFRIEDNLETITIHLQELTEDVVAHRGSSSQKGEKISQPKQPILARAPTIQSFGYEKRIEAIEKKLDQIILRLPSLT